MDVRVLRAQEQMSLQWGVGTVKQGFSLGFLLIWGQQDALLRGSE